MNDKIKVLLEKLELEVTEKETELLTEKSSEIEAYATAAYDKAIADKTAFYKEQIKTTYEPAKRYLMELLPEEPDDTWTTAATPEHITPTEV